MLASKYDSSASAQQKPQQHSTNTEKLACDDKLDFRLRFSKYGSERQVYYFKMMKYRPAHVP